MEPIPKNSLTALNSTNTQVNPNPIPNASAIALWVGFLEAKAS
jgi:hypothetical protein